MVVLKDLHTALALRRSMGVMYATMFSSNSVVLKTALVDSSMVLSQVCIAGRQSIASLTSFPKCVFGVGNRNWF